jgi:hypothetical protein
VRSRKVRSLAAVSRTWLVISQYTDFRLTMITEPHPADTATGMIFRTCKNAHLYHSHMVHSGWLHKCACPHYLPEFLGKTGQSGYRPELDGFDIHAATDLRPQLWEFLTGNTALDACRYGLGYMGNQQDHQQLATADVGDPRSQTISRRSHLNKFRFLWVSP